MFFLKGGVKNIAQGLEVQHEFIPQHNDVFCLFPVLLVMIFNVLFLSENTTKQPLAGISLEIHVAAASYVCLHLIYGLPL